MKIGVVILLIVALPIMALTSINKQLEDFQPKAVATQPARISLPLPKLVPTVVPAVQNFVGSGLLEIAQSWLGVRYQWAGCTRNGVDCSCFIMNVLQSWGLKNVPRSTVPQSQWGSPVDRNNLQLGDLVLFNNTCTGCGPNPTHVGMAIGGGMMIHCGDPCQVAPIMWDHFANARRPPWPS